MRSRKLLILLVLTELARRTGRFPQLAHPRGSVNRPYFGASEQSVSSREAKPLATQAALATVNYGTRSTDGIFQVPSRIASLGQ